jgi:hypothetical protein
MVHRSWDYALDRRARLAIARPARSFSLPLSACIGVHVLATAFEILLRDAADGWLRKCRQARESDQGQAVRTSVQRRTGDRLSATRMLLRARTRGTIAGSVTAGCRHRARQGVGDVRVNDAVRCVGRQHRARLATDLRRPRGCTGRRRLAPSTAGLRPGHLAIALALAKSDVQMAKCS